MLRRIVIGYDGSDEARAAIDFARRSLSTNCALVVNVWHDSGIGLAPAPVAAPPPLLPRWETQLEASATTLAEEGANRAREVGFSASAVVRHGAGPGDVARVLHDVATEYDAELIVVARTHASWLEHLLHASVSAASVRDERVPVLVVPA